MAGNTISTGYYQVTKPFRITYGGAWAITLKANRVLKYDEDTKRLESYDPDEKKWVNRRPPIKGVDNMDFSRYGFARDQREVVSTFTNNTKQISKQEAEKIISGGVVSESKRKSIPTFEAYEVNEAKYDYKRGEPEFGKAPYPSKKLQDALHSFDSELGGSSVNKKDREEIFTKFMGDNDMPPSEEDMDDRLKAKGKDFEKKLTAKLDDLLYNGILMRRNAGMKIADIVSDLKARNYKGDKIDYSDYKG